ncbi:transcription factor with AP2 domain(s), putative [Plasmodium ovale]|uniref:Transcription factor with AP2 domain(S), putative n=2 Tax=Plasmodium ovale TaxID=36330 RepID=A0A1C3L4E1_PLAOA|nr:transcription factor with AP2 domain(s), putative [Plasmodium ovale]
MIFRNYLHSKVITHNIRGSKLCKKHFLQNSLPTFNHKVEKNVASYRIIRRNDKQKEMQLFGKRLIPLVEQKQTPMVGRKEQKSIPTLVIHSKFTNVECNFPHSIPLRGICSYIYSRNYEGIKIKNPFNNDKKSFSGRSGGLKRKKKRKDERVVNTCSGKRLEFFYPKKKRRQRIGLIQNSRKNIVYDNILKRFLVYYYKQGIQVFRSFSCKKKKNFESARNKAIILSKQYDKKYNKQKENDEKSNNRPLSINDNTNLMTKYDNDLRKQIKIIPDKNKSGYRGVFYDPSQHAYICTYNEAGVRKYQIFKIQNSDYLEAYNLAVMCRRYKLFKNYQFVSQRNRIRSGRIHLK